MLRIKTPSPARRSQPPTPTSGPTPVPRPASTPRSSTKKADTFSSKWLLKFRELNQELETAKYELMPTEEKPDPDDDSFMRQVDAATHTQDLIIAFDAEANASRLTMNTYRNKPIQANPFLIADDLRQFVFTFLEEWQKVKNAGWDGLPKHPVWMREFKKKVNAMLENQKNMQANGLKRSDSVIKATKGKGKGRGRPKKKWDSDDDSD